MKKRLLAMLLAMVLTLGLLPVPAMAADTGAELPEMPAFTAVADGVQLEVLSYNDKGYSFYDYNDVLQYNALYTVIIPEGTETVDLSFDRNVLVYNYDSEGEYLGRWYEDYMVGDDEANVMVDYGDESTEADGELDYIQVQSPYDADWNNTTFYAITFIYEQDIPVVTGNVAGQSLKMFPQEQGAYSYYDYMTGGTNLVDVYTMVIPEGTVEVDLSASMNILVYNYDDKGNYLAGWTADYMTGSKTGTVKVDSNSDGEMDYIQVQSPYYDGWNSTLFYVITFVYEQDLVTGSAAGQGLKMFRQEQDAYSYYDYMSDETVLVDVYTMVIPEDTVEVDLSASMNILVYNYDDKGNYLAGWTADYMTGSKTGTVKVDSNSDGEMDYIQVQSPYYDGWNSTLFYVITFATSAELEAAKESCAQYLDANVTPAAGYSGGDWTALGLGRSNYETERYSYEAYLDAVRELTLSKEGVLSSNRYTEYARTCLGLMGAGADPTDVCGYDLLTPLTEYDTVIAQGINGPVYALITLGGAPEYCRTEAMETVCGRYAESILAAQRSDGGWSYMASSATADPDMTAMALTALSFAQTQEGVADAIDAGIACLCALQNEDGTFSSWGEESSETISQIIIALCSLDIAPDTEAFRKQGKSLTQVLADYQLQDGSFCHVLEGGSNLMATEQAMQALDAASRYYSGDAALYDFSDDTAVRTILPFRDVHSTDWYYNDVGTAYNNKIVNGINSYAFSPEEPVTRCQLAAMIYRYAGSPEVTGTLCFTDVPMGCYYYKALVWANQNGILLGESTTVFGPDHNATREQVAAVLMRFARWQGKDTSGRADITAFPDANRVSSFAKDAMAWAVDCGLIKGCIDNGKVCLNPQGTATRAQATVILVRYAAQYAEN